MDEADVQAVGVHRVWMDVSLGVFHALLYGKVYLNFYDFIRFFSSRYEDGISLNLGCGVGSTETTIVPVKAFPGYRTLIAYFNHNQHFSYPLQDPYSSTS